MRPRSLIWLTLIGVVTLALVLLLRPRAVVVEVARAERGPMRIVLREEGETRIEPRLVVASPVTGRLMPIHLDPGHRVLAGDPIARVYPQPLDPRGREQAEASLRARRAALAEARAQVQQMSALASQSLLTLQRTEHLAREDLVAQEELDRARTAHEALARGLAAARARAEAARYEMETAQAALIQSGIGAELAIPAPASGVVLRVFEESERVVSAGEPILEIGDPASMEVVVDVLSTEAVAIQPGTPMTLHPGHGLTLGARVTRVEPAAFTKVSPLGVEEQRVNIIGEILDHASSVGDRYRVQAEILQWEGEDVLSVPAGTVFRTNDGWSVYRVEDGRARLRPVEIGHRDFDRMEILGGLTSGDVVVIYPGEDVTDGARVTVE
jgi:HlyD family secretion protein